MSEVGQRVKDLRKAGHIEEAYRLGRQALGEYPDDWSVRGAFGWVLYDKIKASARLIKEGGHQASNERRELHRLVREYAEHEYRRPDLLFSMILAQLIPVSGELRWFSGLVKWAHPDLFLEDDYHPQVGEDGKVFEALAARCARSVAKQAQDSGDIAEQELAIAIIEDVLERGDPSKPEWLVYRKALLLIQLVRHDQARDLLLPFVQEKHRESWSWHGLAKAEERRDSDLALALCARAWLNVREPVFGLGVLPDFARMAADAGDYAVARWAVDEAVSIRIANRFRLTEELQELLDSAWYKSATTLEAPRERLATLAARSEQVVYGSLPRSPATFLGTFANKQGALRAKFAARGDDTSEELSTGIGGRLDVASLVLGEPVWLITVECDGRADIVHVEKREDGECFDCLDVVCGVVDHQNADKGLACVYVSPENHVLLHYGAHQGIEAFGPGDGVRVFLSAHRERLNAYHYEACEVIESDWVSVQEGKFRSNTRGFGFVKDVFLAPWLATHLNEGEQTRVVAVQKFDRRKGELSWSAVKAEPGGQRGSSDA